MIFKKFFNKDADKVQYFANKFKLSPRTTEIILSRGIDTDEKFEEYLDPKIMHNPLELKGMKELVGRVKLAKELKDKVLIFGDYDVDGVSATAIMLKALKKIGIEADYYLPNRYIDGYGLTNEVIDKIANLFEPNLIITVDCGISCYQEVEYAKTKGIEIVVTDHHEIPENIPDTIVVNAKLPNQEYSFDGLCGTGVAFKFAQALLGEKEAEEYLPIAAIATIVDIVPLIDENRTIVSRGLSLFERYLPIGLKMMLKEYDISLTKPSSTDISFKIGPKLNASGRMGDAGDSLKVYFETDTVKIKKALAKIKEHNTKRQEICNRIYEDCEKMLSKMDMKDQRVISLSSKNWDKGVLGIVCSRIVDKYKKPVFLFAQEGETLCGSGRSIDDINIHELLSSLKDILDTFGGHSMAAGLTLKKKNYDLFVQKINAFALNSISDDVFIPIKYYDQDITEEEITLDFVKELEVLEPFGCENPKPKFKITTNEIELLPMKRCPQHANIKIGKLNLTYFNFIDNLVKITFSRQKSFIFEFQSKSLKGIVDKFDGGSFIVEDAYKKLNSIELSQMVINSTDSAKYKLYPKEELLTFVGQTALNVFGTCFVTYSCYEYVEFCKNYDTKNIYNFGIYEDSAIGYNSVLLSPKGIEWAKNYSKIIFLSPIINSGYIAALNKVTNAEIYVPIEKNDDKRNYAGVDLSRETYGKIFKALTKNNKQTYNIFELYDKCEIEKEISFTSFFVAMLVFKQLGIVSIQDLNEQILVKTNSSIKKDLKQSEIYNSIKLIKDTFKGENNVKKSGNN